MFCHLERGETTGRYVSIQSHRKQSSFFGGRANETCLTIIGTSFSFPSVCKGNHLLVNPPIYIPGGRGGGGWSRTTRGGRYNGKVFCFLFRVIYGPGCRFLDYLPASELGGGGGDVVRLQHIFWSACTVGYRCWKLALSVM